MISLKNLMRRLSFSSNSHSGSHVSDKDLCADNDDSLDFQEDIEKVCRICGEFGKSETWFRCTKCGM